MRVTLEVKPGKPGALRARARGLLDQALAVLAALPTAAKKRWRR